MSSTVGELSEGNSRTIDHMFICGTNCQKMPLRLNNPEDNNNKTKQNKNKTTAVSVSGGNCNWCDRDTSRSTSVCIK